MHAAALGMILVALLAVVGTATSSSSDEGLAIIQARSLAAGDGWIVDHPRPDLDGDGRHYPVEKAVRGPKGFAPLVKHPLYPLLLAGAARLGGVTAMVLLSLAGTVGAALLSGVLADRLRSELARPALWVAGLASPLTHDGYLVLAHTVAAALAVAAVLVALTAFERRSVRAALLVAPIVATTVLLRNEALFFAVGLALASVVVALSRRRGRAVSRGVALVVGAAACGAALVAAVAERAWVGAILGGGLARVAVPAGGTRSLLRGRFNGLLLTWVTPSYGRAAPVILGLLVLVGALMTGAWCVRREPSRAGPVLVAAVIAPLAGTIALLAAPGNRVPGMLVAFPVLAVAIVLVGRAELATIEGTLAAVVVSVFAAGVIATQYSIGGGVEWGGRYFALALPIAVPVALAAIGRHGRRHAAVVPPAAVASLAACSILMTTMGVVSLRQSHDAKTRLVSSIDRAAHATAVRGPVVVSTAFSISALAWPTLDRYEWLYSSPGDLDDLVQRLHRSGIRRFVLVTRSAARDRDIARPASVVRRATPVPGLDVLTLSFNR